MLRTDLTASLSDGRVWVSFAIALALSAGCLLVGTWTARRVGLLSRDAPLGESLGVGLSVGLLVLATFWAALSSGGRSAFTPVAVALAIGIATAAWSRGRRPTPSETDQAPQSLASTGRSSRPIPVLGLFAAVAFILLVGLLYGVTIAPSPRDGVQPVEFMDEAYYSVLGADLARTGTESIYSPSGFDELPNLPSQTWYHWGEMWIAAAVITLTGMDPVLVRHYAVLPVVLLAAATLTGTLVRRLTGTSSTGAFLFGAAASLFLAPVPLPGPLFASWAAGLIFAITLYGLGAVAVLLVMYLVLTGRGFSPPSWGRTIFSGGAVASLIPSHVVLAVLALVGFVGAIALDRVRDRRSPMTFLPNPSGWKRTVAATAAIATLTGAWGLWTGHGVGTSGMSNSVVPFNNSWWASLGLISLGAGTFLAIPGAWLTMRGSGPVALRGLFAGTVVLLLFGAVVWGARLGDFTMFHVFFGGLAAFGTPAAAVAAWTLWSRWRDAGRMRLAAAAFLACAFQLEIGAVSAVYHLYGFSANDYDPIPQSLLSSIASLETDAKLAYVCREREEVAFWDPRLASITAHTGRRVVPMCFQAELFGLLNETPLSRQTASPLFASAPQRALYPRSKAQPSPASVTAFLREHGIEYIYVDRVHPNSIVPDAITIARSGEFRILRVP